MPGDGNVGGRFFDFKGVRLRVDGACRGQYADVAREREMAHRFDGGAYHSQHAAGGVEACEVYFLNGFECFGRGGVAGQYDEMAAVAEERLDGLERVAVDDFEGMAAVGGARVVAQIDLVVLGEQLSDLPQVSQPAVA